jgi:serine protease Do
MKRVSAIVFLVLWAGTGGARAAESVPKPIAVGRVLSSITPGRKWGDVHGGLACLAVLEPLIWGSRPITVSEAGLARSARLELKREGFTIAGDPDDPFGKTLESDLILGGTVTSLTADLCLREHGAQVNQKGEAKVEIDWQVYSTIERKVVAKGHTSGSARVEQFDVEGALKVIQSSIGDSLQQFTRSETFTMLEKQAEGSASVGPTAQNHLELAGASKAGPTKISEAIGSVVLVLSGGGHGSGFLVSSDGYVMTAEHVVGSDKYVKIRWSDGLEGVGEVVRTDKRRDVALIKTDPRGRQPLALRRESPQPGDTVFAIGAPIDPKLQNTVTRGVVSANRIMDGFSFIQSDVTVDPGNSGGPLLDEQGRVLGFTDKGLRSAEAPTGLNFFVPIDDALRFLSAEPQ